MPVPVCEVEPLLRFLLPLVIQSHSIALSRPALNSFLALPGNSRDWTWDFLQAKQVLCYWTMVYYSFSLCSFPQMLLLLLPTYQHVWTYGTLLHLFWTICVEFCFWAQFTVLVLTLHILGPEYLLEHLWSIWHTRPSPQIGMVRPSHDALR